MRTRARRFAFACAVTGMLAVSSGDATAEDARIHPQLWPAADRPLAPSPATEAAVEDLLGRMSLEDKIGQMIQADIDSITPEDLRTYKLGALLAGGNAAPARNPRSGPQAWLELVDRLYRAAMEPSGSHLPIPPLFGIDAVHGHAKVRGATIFPHNVGLGATHDPQLVAAIARATAEEVSATGIDWSFAPTVAVVRDVRWGRSYESYSDDPVLVATYARAFVEGLQGPVRPDGTRGRGAVLASVKHYLGDGGTLDGRDQGDNRAPEGTLLGVHAAGFMPAIQAGDLIVMVSYSSWQGVKMHANRDLLTGVLKDRMSFPGFVVGDWNAHEEVPGCTKLSCPEVIRAGLDMFMAPDSWKAIFRNTLAQARAGEIEPARIDDAVRRILRVKVMAGLFSQPAPAERRDAGNFSLVGSPEHRALARRAVRESLVLLKNERAVLPLSPRSHLLVTGPAADRIDMQAGGWTVDWQGDQNHNVDFPGGTSIFSGIRSAVEAAGGTATLSPDGHFENRPDAAVVVFGEHPYAEYEGDLETLEYDREDQTSLGLLRSLHAQGIPTVAVFLSGRPLWVNRELNVADAFVAAWLPGTAGEGVADVLLGGTDGVPRYDFVGRLSFPWPATGMPVTYDSGDHIRGALFGRGYGLSYAHPARLGRLPEAPRLAPDRGNPDSLFQAAHATAPWSLFVSDATGQVRVTTPDQPSPGGAVRVLLSDAAFTVAWQGGSTGDFWIGGRPADLSAAVARGDVLRVRARVEERPAAAVQIGLRCSSSSQAAATGCGLPRGALLDATAALNALPAHEWRWLTIPLACFSQAPELTRVAAPIALRTDGSLKLSVTDIHLAGAGQHGCGGVGVQK
ncbi:MAG: glycoside hydrolase family 3 C-terminal domain-containing protein [Proteobacteria bacterium]|nr:glycoside hydrolase family 3 C-terminal domain-containing protein [Pseudomonadota bacterium]